MGPWWDALRQLTAMTLIAKVLDMLMPSGSMKKYTRLVSGLVIMLLVLRPIAGLFLGSAAETDVVERLMNMTEAR